MPFERSWSATTAIGMINGLMLGTGWGVFHTTDNLVRSNDVVGFSKGARLVAREAANTGAYTAALVAAYCGGSGFSQMVRGTRTKDDWVDASCGGASLGCVLAYGSKPHVLLRTAGAAGAAAGLFTYIITMYKRDD